MTSFALSDEGFEKVLQQNLNKIEKVNSYSSEFVIDYVTPSRDYNEVLDILNRVQELSDSLCSGLTNDYDKIKVLHDYVSDNVYYDFVAKEDFANLETISLKNVLDNKRTICAGYANFFSALCNAQGIYCVNIRGSVTTSEVPDITLDEAPTNHEWTAVWLESESRWVYVDCTWDSANRYYSDDNIVSSTHRNTYFDISVEKLSNDHKAKIVDYRNFFAVMDYFAVDESTEDSNAKDSVKESTEENASTSKSTSSSTTADNVTTTANTTSANTNEDSQMVAETLATAENTADVRKNLVTVICLAVSSISAIAFSLYSSIKNVR
jgi:hypothetical protein